MTLVSIRTSLLTWFADNARDLPWRRKSDPYATWISEIMLQQTQVATVVPYFERFMARFPNVGVLAAAPLADVLKAWEGLGYYRRARNAHRAAQIIVRKHNGVVPADAEALLALPGIGRYTAGAILSISFAQAAPVLDGNVKRVLSRLDDMEANIDEPSTEHILWQRATELVDPVQPGVFNEALMELGAVICLPAQPRCLICPLRDVCLACANGTQYERPVRKARRKIPHYDVVAGIIVHRHNQNQILIAQRPTEGMLGGLWEFPGGKIEDGESAPEALARELLEEMDIEVHVGAFLTSIEHAYTHFRITLHAYFAQHLQGEPQKLGVDDFQWVTMNDLERFAFARTDLRIIEALNEHIQNNGGS